MSKTFKEFISESLDVPAARTVDVVISDVIVECFSMIVKSRVHHLITDSYSTHEALEGFYTKLQDQTDEPSEKFLATGGSLEEFDIKVVPEMCLEMCPQNLQNLRDVVSGAISATSDPNLQSINDILVSIQKNVDQTSYLLGLS